MYVTIASLPSTHKKKALKIFNSDSILDVSKFEKFQEKINFINLH